MDEAIRHYKEEMRIQPNAAQTYFNLGVALKEKGSWDEAIRAFEDFIRRAPRDDEQIQEAREHINEAREWKARPVL